MKLTDKRFISGNRTVHQEREVFDKDTIKAAVNPLASFEQLYDKVAQVTGPNPLDDTPMADDSETVDLSSDKWPEQDIRNVIRDLKTQGMDEMKIWRQLIDMSVLGTDRPMAQESEWLWGIIKTAQADLSGDNGPEGAETSNAPETPESDQDVGADPAPISDLSSMFEVKFTHNTGAAGSAEELSSMLKSMGTSGVVEEVAPGLFNTDLPEELEHKLLADGAFTVNIDQYVLSSGSDVGGAAPTASNDGNGPAGSIAAPMDGQRDSLSSTEMEGTGKMGQIEDDEKDKKPKGYERAPGAPVVDENNSGDSLKNQDSGVPSGMSQPLHDNDLDPSSGRVDPRGQATIDSMEASKALWTIANNKTLAESLSSSQKQAVGVVFDAYLKGLHEQYLRLESLVLEADNPRPFQPREFNKYDKMYLKRQHSKMQGLISNAGSLLSKLVKALGHEAMGITPSIEWLEKQMKKTKKDDADEKVEDDSVKMDSPDSSIPKNPDNLFKKNPNKVVPTKKKSQMEPPPAAPGGVPPSDGPPMDSQPAGEEMSEMSDRSLSDLMADISVDLQELQERIENGETMSGGQDLEPIVDDSGAVPAPPSKVAVDDDAKEYYDMYFGEYGEQLTHDRIANIIDSIDSITTASKIKLSDESVAWLSKFVASSASEGNEELDIIRDEMTINFLIKSNTIDPSVKIAHANTVKELALNAAPMALKTSVVKLADKMKMPKVKGQSDDAVKLDKMEDNAADDELMRPAHLKMTIDSQYVDGAYTKLVVKWDPKDESARRSNKGLEHAVRSFVKGLESTKEFKDFGFLGQVNVEELDPKKGTALAYFRTMKPADSAPHVLMTELK